MLLSFLAVLLIALVAWVGSQIGLLQYLFGMVLPLIAFAVFIGGMIWRVTYWAKSPVPFAIPTTGGQERSLDWVKPARLDAPTTTAGVVGRMLLEVLCFRSLFRNMETRVDPENMRITYFSTKWLWLFALIFHYSFLVTFLRHFRFFVSDVPCCIEALSFVDGILQIGAPTLMLSNVLILAALTFLFLRRVCNPKLRYISMANDFFPLFVIIAIVISGMMMRYCFKIDVAQAKVFIMGILHFSPQSTEGLGSIFFIHVTFVSTLLLIFPFCKLVHMGGVFMSPTRNLKCNTREEHHDNPWNYPTQFHTYAEYEDDFREAMASADLPLEKQPEAAGKTE